MEMEIADAECSQIGFIWSSTEITCVNCKLCPNLQLLANQNEAYF